MLSIQLKETISFLKTRKLFDGGPRFEHFSSLYFAAIKSHSWDVGFQDLLLLQPQSKYLTIIILHNTTLIAIPK